MVNWPTLMKPSGTDGDIRRPSCPQRIKVTRTSVVNSYSYFWVKHGEALSWPTHHQQSKIYPTESRAGGGRSLAETYEMTKFNYHCQAAGLSSVVGEIWVQRGKGASQRSTTVIFHLTLPMGNSVPWHGPVVIRPGHEEKGLTESTALVAPTVKG